MMGFTKERASQLQKEFESLGVSCEVFELSDGSFTVQGSYVRVVDDGPPKTVAVLASQSSKQ